MTEFLPDPGDIPPTPDVAAQITEFDRLRREAHEQIAQLAVTVSKLEHLRQQIERQILPKQR